MTHALSRFCCFTGVGIQFGVTVTLATATLDVLTLAFVNREEDTCYDSAHHTDQEVEGYNFRTQLSECPKNYMAFNLNRNERVNSRGVELHLTGDYTKPSNSGTDDTHFSYTQRVWLEVASLLHQAYRDAVAEARTRLPHGRDNL